MIREATRMHDRRRPQSGFSLVELMIAMTVTLIVSGAVYGLLAVGQKAFRREPERSDLQQSLRLAMDMITRDVQNVGHGMNVFAPKFAPGLNDVGDDTLTPPEVGTIGKWDKLSMLTDDGSCPKLWVAPNPAVPVSGAAAVLNVPTVLPPCIDDPDNAAAPRPFVAIIGRAPSAAGSPERTFWGWATYQRAAGPPQTVTILTTASGTNVDATVAAEIKDALDGPGVTGIAGAAGASPAIWMKKAIMVRYELAYGAGDLIPSLYRSATGGFAVTATGGAAGRLTSPSQGAQAIADGQWELVARGIEDLQIEYRTHNDGTGDDTWTDEPPAVVADDTTTTEREDVDSLVREIRVTLGGRTEPGAPIEGATDGPTGLAIRSRLTASIVPRSVLMGIHGLAASGTTAVWR